MCVIVTFTTLPTKVYLNHVVTWKKFTSVNPTAFKLKALYIDY